jgi:hypothetical protein
LETTGGPGGEIMVFSGLNPIAAFFEPPLILTPYKGFKIELS